MKYLWFFFAYLAGSCPTGFLASKLIKGVDIRTFGSGNIGATNTGRLLGKKWAFIVAFVDIFKGAFILLLATYFVRDDLSLAIIGACSVIGHNYPIWLKFNGGKGVATTFGVFGFFDFFNPLPALLGGLSWYLIMKCTKYVSIASMGSLFVASYLMFLFGMPKPYYITAIFLSLLAVLRHRSNIANIVSGEEDKVSS